MAFNPLWPLVYDQTALNVGAGDTVTVPVWTDLTSRVTARSFDAGRNYELDRNQAGTAVYTVDDRDEALNPLNPTSPFAGQLVPYRRIRTLSMWPLAGNIYNASQTSDDGAAPDYGESSNFEGGATGAWRVGGSTPPAISNSGAHFFNGSKSMLVTLPTGAGGSFVTNVQLPYPVYLWGLAVGQTYSIAVRVWVPVGVGAFNLSLGGSPTTVGSSHTTTTTTAAFEKLFVSFVCNDPVANVLILAPTAATTAGQQVWVDAAQLELGTVSGSYSTTGPDIHGEYYGYIERFPPRWDAQGRYGWIELSCVDELATLAQLTYLFSVAHDILADNPTFFYPLFEPASSDSGGNISGVNQPSLTVAFTGQGAGTVQFGQQPGQNDAALFALASPPANAVVFTPTSTTNGQYLRTTLSTPVNAAGFSLEVWAHTPASTPAATEIFAAVADTAGRFLTLEFDSDGDLHARLYSAGGISLFNLTVALIAGPAGWDQYVLTVSASGFDWAVTAYIGGGLFATATWTGAGTTSGTVGPWTGVWAGGSPKFGDFDDGIAYVAGFPSALSLAQVKQHVDGAVGFYTGESVTNRFARVLAWAGHSGTVLGSGPTTMGSPDAQAGASFLTVLQGIADTEGGALYVSQLTGLLTLETRRFRQLAVSPAFVLGENSAGGEIPYEQDVGWSEDPDYVYNDITVDRYGGQTVRVLDAASRLAYLPRSYPLTVYSGTDSDATDHANYLLYKYKQPVPRVTRLSIEGVARAGAAWPAVLGMTQGTRVTVKRRLSNGQTYSADYFVERNARVIDPGQWRVTLELSPAAFTTFWILGDATFGVLGSTSIAGW